MNFGVLNIRLGGVGGRALAALALAGAVLAGCASLPNDGATATVKRFDGWYWIRI